MKQKKIAVMQSLIFERETDDDETVQNGLSSFRYHDLRVMIVGNSISLHFFLQHINNLHILNFIGIFSH